MSHDHGRRHEQGSHSAQDATGRSPGKRTLTDRIQRKAVQRRAEGAASDDVHALAAAGTAGPGVQLPFLDRIQMSFGDHDVGGVVAHTDGAAAEASAGMGARAFACGDHVAFAGAPDLHTAAHEAAHVVQQRAGVHLKGGVGEAGDVYERQADAVADRVVAGESAADLLGPAPATTVAGSVQRDEIELGKAGRGTMASVDPVQLPDPPAPAKQRSVLEAATAAMPHVQGVMKAIQIASDVYEKIVGKPVRVEKGESSPLEPFIKGSSKEQLDRVLRYKMATMLVTDIMRIGKMAGIDFAQWTGGLPPLPQAAPAPAAAAPAAATPAPPAAPAPVDSAAAQRGQVLQNQLTALSLEDLKSRAKIWLEEMVEQNTRHLGDGAGAGVLNKWHWNGANERGFGPAENFDNLPSERIGFPGGYDHDHDKRTSATVTWYAEVTGITDGTMAGLPKEVEHFDPMTIESTPMKGLGWYLGGSCGIVYRKADGDELKTDIDGTKGTPAVPGTMGGYHMRFTFFWDNGPTTMTCDVFAMPGTPWPVVTNIVADGTPET